MNRFLISILISFTPSMITDAQTDTTTLTRVGDIAPSFRCITDSGISYDLSQLRGKIIMINFFATWCPPCNLELPEMQNRIWNRYKNDNRFVLLVIGREHSNKVVAGFKAEKGYDMHFVADPERQIYSLFANQFIPRNVIIDRDGRIIFQNRGYTVEEFKMIEDILAEKLGQDQINLN